METSLDHHWGISGQHWWHDLPDKDVLSHLAEEKGHRFYLDLLSGKDRSTSAENNEPEDGGIDEALESLDDIASDAHEMGYSVPEVAVVDEAKRILLEMHGYRTATFDAYSMSEGRVGIGVHGEFGRSMLVVCEPERTALCVVTVNRKSRHARYDDSSFLPDDFVRQGLRQVFSSPLPLGAESSAVR